MLVSIIVPTYRQEKTIKQDIENIYNTMSHTRWDFEIIVVIDGYLDKSLQEAKKVKKDNVIVIGYETNRGKGYAIRYGMARAKGDHIAFIDAGMDINPNGISMILEHMEWYDADIIIGSKKHPASILNYPFSRRLYLFGYYMLVKILFGLKVKDTQTGLKVFKRKVLEAVLPRLIVKRFAFDIEVLAVARYLGFTKIYEAPVQIHWEYDNTSFKGFLFLDRHIRYMLLDTIAIFYRLKILNYYADENKRKWVYDKELQMRVNTGK